jgi:hypothetical protein
MPISSTIRFFVIVLLSGGYSVVRYQDGSGGTPPLLPNTQWPALKSAALLEVMERP